MTQPAFLTSTFSPVNRYRVATLVGAAQRHEKGATARAAYSLLKLRVGDSIAPVVAALSAPARDALLPVLASEGIAI